MATRARGGRTALRAEKLSAVVARQILHDIQDDGLSAGDRLPPESVMCERFEVGKASVREALRILETNGLITIKTGNGGGPVVADFDGRGFGQMSTLHFQALGATLRDLLEARIAIEPTLAAAAATNPDPEAAKRVRAALESSLGHLDREIDEFAQENSGFHGAVIAASGNPVLATIALGLRDIWALRIDSIPVPDDYRHEIEESHTELAAAIEAHDAEAAERISRAHLVHYRELCDEHFPDTLRDRVEWR
nr:FCD domain-containing protein [Gordonia sp. LAM0048]